jgi:pimeloyl-ACP methyl ester carboxylesterase
MQEGEAIAYANVLAKARLRNDAAAIAELEALGPPPYAGLEEIATQRKWATTYEVGMPLEAAFVLPQLLAPRTHLADIYDLALATAAAGTHFVGPEMHGPMTQVDLRQLGPEFALPIFLIQGTADDFTPAELSRAWLDSLAAPKKVFVPIENAGHFALTAHGEEFLQALREQVLPLAAPPSLSGAL